MLCHTTVMAAKRKEEKAALAGPVSVRFPLEEAEVLTRALQQVQERSGVEITLSAYIRAAVRERAERDLSRRHR